MNLMFQMNHQYQMYQKNLLQKYLMNLKYQSLYHLNQKYPKYHPNQFQMNLMFQKNQLQKYPKFQMNQIMYHLNQTYLRYPMYLKNLHQKYQMNH